MQILFAFLEVFVPVSYALTVSAYGLAFFQEVEVAEKLKSKFLVTTALLHTLYIGTHTSLAGHCLVTTPFEIMSLIAYTVTICYAIIEFSTKIKGTGFFLMSLAGLFEFISAVTMHLPQSGAFNPILSNLGIGLHISAAIIGYGAIAISAVYGVLYLLLYRELKKGRFGSIYRHLPSLEDLERLHTVATIIGFSFITVAIVIGGFWLPRVFPAFSLLDPKLIVTAFIWAVYSIVLMAKYLMHLDGKRVISLSIGGFVLSIFSMTIVNAFMGSFHSFFR